MTSLCHKIPFNSHSFHYPAAWKFHVTYICGHLNPELNGFQGLCAPKTHSVGIPAITASSLDQILRTTKLYRLGEWAGCKWYCQWPLTDDGQNVASECKHQAQSPLPHSVSEGISRMRICSFYFRSAQETSINYVVAYAFAYFKYIPYSNYQ